MEILKVAHKELPHSNFLAWLFDPNANHQLGDVPLKEFIKIYFKENDFQNLGTASQLSVFDFVYMQGLGDLEVKREYKNIDLVLSSKTEKLCIVIENKIYASESIGQLEKYRDIIEQEYSNHKRFYIYLSLDEQDISNDHYIQLNYDHIIKLITYLLNLNMSDMVRFTLQQYLNTLNSMCNKDESIERITQQLYRKYKPAFDLVFKYVGSDLDKVRRQIIEWMKTSPLVKLLEARKHSIRFEPNITDEKALPLNFSEMYWLEINFKNESIDFYFWIRKKDNQKSIEALSQAKNDLFEPMNRHPRWYLAHKKNIITDNEIASYINKESSEMNNIINSKLRKLLVDFDLILNEIKQAFHSNS